MLLPVQAQALEEQVLALEELELDPPVEPTLWDQPHRVMLAQLELLERQVPLALQLMLVARQSSLTPSLSKASKVQRVALFSENVQQRISSNSFKVETYSN